MESLLVIFSVLLLVTPGLAFMLLVTPVGASSRIALVLGNGFFLGLVGVPVIMRLLNAVGLPLSFTATATSTLLVTGAILLIARRKGRFLSEVWTSRSIDERLSRFEQCALALLLLLIIVRWAALTAEVVWRPLFPWDATQHWAIKARVWFEYLELRPFVENAEWLRSQSSEVYTEGHPDYPITIPLLQLWMTSAMGSWNESLMNLPWVICFVALGTAFYAQAREAGASALMSMTFTYFLLSMPLLNTHVALAGYADLFLGACYCLAIMAFHNWSQSRERFQAVLAALFAVSCTLIKNEGFFWMLTFLPACLVVLYPGRRSLLLLLGLSIIVCATLLFFPRDVVVAGHSLAELQIYYRVGALKSVYESFFVHDNWHLFAYLLTALLFLVLLFRRSIFIDLRGVGVALGAALALFLFLFVFTAYSGGALRFTAVGRISLQLVPAGMFFCLLLYRALTAGSQPARAQRGSDIATT